VFVYLSLAGCFAQQEFFVVGTALSIPRFCFEITTVVGNTS